LSGAGAAPAETPHREPPARESSGPPPTVRRIPPREPATRPDPVEIVRPLQYRSPLQLWGTRIVALVLVIALLTALALILTGVL